MERALVDGVELEHESRGAGEPVVLAHAGVCADWFAPLMVGHSSSANIALQLALDAPEVVGSLALLEPALMPVPSRAAWGQAVAAPAMERCRAGDAATAIDIWMRGVAGPAYRGVLDDALPGAFDQAVADADTFFGQELPAVQGWSFGREDATRLLHLQQPRALAEALAAFFARHPLA